MFGGKKTGRTVLLLDIESGSVATALLTLSKKEGPQLFAYKRIDAPLESTRSSESIFKTFTKTLEESLITAAEVAARMRMHGREDVGTISHIAVFFSAPWGMPDLHNNKKNFADGVVPQVHNALEKFFGSTRASYHTSADALAFSARTFDTSSDALIASLRGELLEMLLFNKNAVQAYSTVPVGTRNILRTLKAHGQLTEHEARSMLALLSHAGESEYEPLVASGEHIGRAFAEGAELLVPYGRPTTIVVVGERPLADWLTKRIAEEEKLANLFSEHTTVESLKQHYFAAPLATSPVVDPFILAEAAYVDARAAL